MDIQKRIKAFSDLGEKMRSLGEEELEDICYKTFGGNGWFTQENVTLTFEAIGDWLTEDKLKAWIGANHKSPTIIKDVGIVMAGNIPMVGFHDLLCVLISGHKVSIKPSSKDTYLMELITDWIIALCPEFEEFITYPDRLNHVDAIIATGSDNSARYFEQYFKAKPRIIRKNRVSIAVLSGQETEEQIKNLGLDMYAYYGLGCRNVSKIYVPQGFDIRKIFPDLEQFSKTLDNHKYQNNYDYNKSIYLINGVGHYDTGFGLFKEDNTLVSPISVVFYEEYPSETELNELLDSHEEKIQCIVSDTLKIDDEVPFVEAQRPGLSDYADGVDTIAFLATI